MFHTSILDTDLYKLTQQNAVLKLYPDMKVSYIFINRDKRAFPDGFQKELRKILLGYQGLRLTKDEKDFLREKCYYLSPAYIDFLSGYQYDPTEVSIIQYGPDLHITIEGYWYRTILWEVPLMQTISELFFKMTGEKIYDDDKQHEVNKNKGELLKANDIYFSEFGSRRRYSYLVQRTVINDLKCSAGANLIGTSNIHMAHIYNLTPMGTVAHEWFQAHAALYGYRMANERAMNAWIQTYKGDLGISLSDTFTTGVFLKTFDKFYARLFDGVRQDSGDPIDWVDKIVEKYKSLRIDPASKAALFSDGLSGIDQIVEIKNESDKGGIKPRFGIGTWFTNDVGVKPLNIVIKLSNCKVGDEWIPTVKLSDVATKHTGEANAIKLCKTTLGLE
jgi:nicotinate phosphoribosyltransferase